MVYEGMGWMISAAVPDVQMVCQLVQSLLSYSHQEFRRILDQANQNMQVLMVQENVKKIDLVIKINQRVVSSAGSLYVYYLQTIFNDLIKVYGCYTSSISQSVMQPGSYPDFIIKSMKSVRRDILRLIQAYIN
jgi:hypothetical protein